MERGHGCYHGEYANVLLAMPKGVSRALQQRRCLQIAISSVARAVWCGSGVIVDGKTEYTAVQRSRMASFASRRVATTVEGCHRGEYANTVACCQRTLRVQRAPGAADRDQLCS